MKTLHAKLKSFSLHLIAATAVSLCFAGNALADKTAETAPAVNEVCRDNQLLSFKLFTDVCWSCIFPIKVAGITMGPSGKVLITRPLVWHVLVRTDWACITLVY